MRVIVALVGVLSLLVVVTGCWPFNTNPTASFTVSAVSGEAPLTVNFSAILSTDPDGNIEEYEWDFGDGASGSGRSVSHTYASAGIFTAVLLVTDDNGGQDTAQKTITVTAPPSDDTGGGTGPTASFTATPLTGESPLTVTFNASASVYAEHDITYYSWDFGDGVTGTGITTTHTYSPATTTTYNVVLRIIASDNSEDTASKSVTVTVSTGTAPSTAPTASFTVTPDSEQIGPHKFTLNPEDSKAAAGYEITTYVWSFGDQSSETKTSNEAVDHNYYASQASESFTATLTVIDDGGKTDSYSRTVRVKNLQPIAGFEMSKVTWDVKDIEITNAQTASHTISFRSEAPTGDLWDQDRTTDEADLPNGSTATKPTNFETDTYESGDQNLSYDPEGNGTNTFTWGIVSYIWDFGDGNTLTVPARADGSCPNTDHVYALTASEQQRTFTVKLEVMDNQGARNTLTRTIKLYK
jgi:PKD repeat protein